MTNFHACLLVWFLMIPFGYWLFPKIDNYLFHWPYVTAETRGRRRQKTLAAVTWPIGVLWRAAAVIVLCLTMAAINVFEWFTDEHPLKTISPLEWDDNEHREQTGQGFRIR